MPAITAHVASPMRVEPGYGRIPLVYLPSSDFGHGTEYFWAAQNFSVSGIVFHFQEQNVWMSYKKKINGKNGRKLRICKIIVLYIGKRVFVVVDE